MNPDEFNKTTIGQDIAKHGQPYHNDVLLDYLSGLLKMQKEQIFGSLWYFKYAHEIEAVKEVLKNQNDGIH